MSLALVNHLYLVICIFDKCKTYVCSSEFFKLEDFTKIIQNRAPVFIFRKLESHEVC